jgi:hypothetical protein
MTFACSISSCLLWLGIAGSNSLPIEAAGVSIPRTPLAVKAENYIRSVEPDFLFNHSVRTYLFGAISLRARGLSFDPETAYVAALFHDLGLVPTMASESYSFEIDGANHVETFIVENGGTKEQGRTAWNAVAMHDMGRAFQSHQTNEALLLGAGARSDVNGPDPNIIAATSVREALKAFPRPQFKKRFTAAAIDHCLRKPTSQIGWLSVLCLKVAPNIDRGSVAEGIASAPFDE